MFTKEFIAGEVAALGFGYPSDAVIATIAARAKEYVDYDDFLTKEIMEKVDQAIFDENLPEID